jgi:hypothetical protein
MSSFYTNYFMRGRYLYLKKVVDGIRSREKVEISPVLYVRDNKGIGGGIHRDI